MGGGASGTKDGRCALFLADPFPLRRPTPETRPDRPIHDRLREVLHARGASFFPQLLAAARGGFAPELGDALWDLVWAGEVTTDSFHAVRALLAPIRRSRRGASVGRAMHLRSLERFTVRDDVAGRWSLTEAAGDAPITPTERATAQIRQLLERHGVLTREVVRSEGTGGGFAAALAAEVGSDRRSTLFIQSVDGAPVDESPLADPLREAGFARTPRGYLRRVSRI